MRQIPTILYAFKLEEVGGMKRAGLIAERANISKSLFLASNHSVLRFQNMLYRNAGKWEVPPDQ